VKEYMKDVQQIVYYFLFSLSIKYWRVSRKFVILYIDVPVLKGR